MDNKIEALLNGEEILVNGNSTILTWWMVYNTHISKTLKTSVEYRFNNTDEWKTLTKYTNWYYRPLTEKLILPFSETSMIYLRNLTSDGWFYNLEINNEFIEISDNTVVPDEDLTYQEIPLTFEILEDGYIWLNCFQYSAINSGHYNFYYSYDKVNWNKFLYFEEETGLEVHANEKIYFAGYTGNISDFNGLSDFQTDFYNPYLAILNTYMNYCAFKTTCQFNISGNILSLIRKNNFKYINTLTTDLYALFVNCDNLISCKNLVLPTNVQTNYSFTFLFEGCSSMIEAPIIPDIEHLNELTLENKCSCYYGMFLNCTSLNKIIFLEKFDENNMDYYDMGEFLLYTAETGTLYKDPEIDSSLFTSIIPDGWTIEDYIPE